jgi:YbbR domain-containing protein
MTPFRREHGDRRTRSTRSWFAWGDLGTWLVALATAFGLWLFVNTGERMSERTLRVRLEPENLPPGLVITNQGAEHAEVRVSGPGVILSGIDVKRMRTPLDLAGVRPGIATYAINPKMFQLPRKVEVLRVTPAQVSLHVDRMSRRLLPVRLERRGEVPPGYAVISVEVSPDKVEVSGPAMKLEGLRAVATETIDFAELGTAGGREILSLVRPVDDALVDLEPAEVVLDVKVAPVMSDREFKNVAVGMHGGAEGWKVEPAAISVVVRGPELELKDAILAPGSVYVEIGEPATATTARPIVDLPEGLELVRTIPEEVKIKAPATKRTGRGAKRSESKRE